MIRQTPAGLDEIARSGVASRRSSRTVQSIILSFGMIPRQIEKLCMRTRIWSNRLPLLFGFSIIGLAFALSPTSGQTNGSAQVPQKQSYKMLVLGDSVVWGQGLLRPVPDPREAKPDEKFSTLIHNKIAKELQRDVLMVDKSQSGARILPEKKNKKFIQFNQEVPSLTPTLWEQLDDAVTEYNCPEVPNSKGSKAKRICSDVDFVLLDGGINDIGFQNLVNPFTSQRWIRCKSHKFLGTKMTEFLVKILNTFPNANIIVTGYFPIICAPTSTDPTGTDPNFIKNLIRAYLGWDAEDLTDSTDFSRNKDKKEYISQLKKTGFTTWPINELSERSSTWKTASDSDLENSVRKANGIVGDDRAFFAKVNFGNKDCYAAPDTKLWRLNGFEENKDPKTDDHRLKDRIEGKLCETGKQMMDNIDRYSIDFKILELTCKPAGTGHPNTEGAKMYENAIWNVLQPLLRGVNENSK